VELSTDGDCNAGEADIRGVAAMARFRLVAVTKGAAQWRWAYHFYSMGSGKSKLSGLLVIFEIFPKYVL
jgi:hypothetical protein